MKVEHQRPGPCGVRLDGNNFFPKKQPNFSNPSGGWSVSLSGIVIQIGAVHA